MSSSQIPSQAIKFNIVLSSQELKRQILIRIEKLNVSLFKLCNQLQIQYGWVRIWMNSDNVVVDHKGTKQRDILLLAESLGLDIRITIVKKPIDTAYAIPYIAK